MHVPAVFPTNKEGKGICMAELLCCSPETIITLASLVAQTVKNLPAEQKTRVQPLGQEDPLEEEMATHSSILAWRTP